MRKLILAAVAALLLAAPAADAAQNHRAVRSALAAAYRWWDAKPSCVPAVHFGALPDGWAMGESQASCTIRINPRYWTATMLRAAARPGVDAYRQVVWQTFCASIIDEVGGLEGHPFSTDYNYEHVYAFCGVKPKAHDYQAKYW